MRRLLAAALMLGAIMWPDPVLAVLRSGSLTVTDQGRPIPGATIMLTRPRPHTPRAAAAPSRSPAQPPPSYAHQPPPSQPQAYQSMAYPALNPCPPGYDYAPGYNPECYQRPLGATWIGGKTDAYGRLVLQFDDREAAPGTLVDITAYYPNGEMRRLIDVPVEMVLGGGGDRTGRCARRRDCTGWATARLCATGVGTGSHRRSAGYYRWLRRVDWRWRAGRLRAARALIPLERSRSAGLFRPTRTPGRSKRVLAVLSFQRLLRL
jgi:hypothetical protein